MRIKINGGFSNEEECQIFELECDGKVVGYFFVDKTELDSKLAYELACEVLEQRKGYGTEALKFFSNIVENPFLRIRPNNIFAKKSAGKCGFSMHHFEGKHEIWTK